MKKTILAAAVSLGVSGGLAFGLANTFASASVPDSTTGVITACMNGDHAVRLIDAQAGATCNNGETQVTWNQSGATGAQGPAGPAGPTGPAGASGAVANGYQIVTANSPYEEAAVTNAPYTMTATANCPSGQSAVGGGYALVSSYDSYSLGQYDPNLGTSQFAYGPMVANGPTSGGNGWTVTMSARGSGDDVNGYWYVKTYAICINS